ncbi:GumK N-terminal domain-containing glycosyltransferase [Paraburkholderia sediminicola]|uniref:GumK N-terminal domain-containing glycosyltransferase n=1 Tax=Paraburkholderia sediminicola TaxID=458836 RepID=UPI0038B710C0
MEAKYLIISKHDFRSARKADIHFLSKEMATRGKTRFFSVGFSSLSKYKRDPRISLSGDANEVREFEGVQCFLWKTWVHPFNLSARVLAPLEHIFFDLYVKSLPQVFFEWVRDSSHIVLESGMPAIFCSAVRKINPNAKLIYTASDDLETIGCARYISKALNKSAELYDWIRVPSRKLAEKFPNGKVICFIPHGIDPDIENYADPSPYADGLNAVSVGSMLFDADCIVAAAQEFPSMKFHIIGAGRAAENLSEKNIKIYPEMPFRDTLPYIKHANIGLAPYAGEKVHPYLTDTSMKLAQYAFFRVPAVCPDAVVGDHSGRFGYDPGNRESIVTAISAALRARKVDTFKGLAWADVTDRLLSPHDFPELIMGAQNGQEMGPLRVSDHV